MTDRRGVFSGLVFVVIGVAFLLDELGVVQLRLTYLFPLLLILLGGWIVAEGLRRQGRDR
jgi:uncharacterized membrane protein YjgN (DUF898 family)